MRATLRRLVTGWGEEQPVEGGAQGKEVATPEDGSNDPGWERLSDAELGRLANLLQAGSGFDVRHYKTATVQRRVLRRMGLAGFGSVEAYLERLRHSDREQQALVRELLIGVTEFFRDLPAFDELKGMAIERLVDSAAPGSSLRVWVPGCATGEEAYSIAILLLETLEARQKAMDVQVFATDVNEEALSVARAGEYAGEIAQHVSQARLGRFFRVVDGRSYRVAPAVREVVSFAIHDVCADPPFSRMDLVSCRNLLIYLKPHAQEHVLRVLHFALKPGGYLLLGSSEAVSAHRDSFSVVSKDLRIYQKVGTSRVPSLPRPGQTGRYKLSLEQRLTLNSGATRWREKSAGLIDLARDALLDTRVAPSLVLSEEDRILYVHGDPSPYVSFPKAEPRLELHGVLRDHLATRVRAALYKCRRDGVPVTVVSTRPAGEPRVQIAVNPAAGLGRGAAIVSFEPLPASSGDAASPGAPGSDQDSVIEHLERELDATREDLRHTVEELESYNEELRASHEEAMSMNEELQSANEELEATTEELRSVNEELSAVNVELRDKIKQLERAHNDLSNFFQSTKLATLFLDESLRIGRFTPAAAELFRLTDADRGREAGDFACDLLQVGLAEGARAVLRDLSVAKRELRAADGRWFERCILPYRTEDRRIEGVVVTFSDISDVKQASERLARNERQQAVVARLGQRALEEGQLQVFLDQVVREVQQTLEGDFCKVLELEPDGRLLLRAGVGWKEGAVGTARVPGDLSSQAGHTMLVRDPVLVEDMASERRFSGPALLQEHGVASGLSCVISDGHTTHGVLGVYSRVARHFTMEDAHFLVAVSNVIGNALAARLAKQKLRDNERRYRQQAAELQAIYETLPVGVGLFDRAHRMVKLNRRLAELTQVPFEAFAGPAAPDPFAGMGEAAHAFVDRVFETGERISDVELEKRLPGGPRRHWLCSYGPIHDGKHEVLAVSVVVKDITGRKRAEEALREADRQKDQFLAMLGHELRNPLTAIRSATELLKLVPEHGPQLQRIQGVLDRQTLHMSRLIDGLLDVSRIVRGKISLERETLSLVELLHDLISDRRAEIEARGLTLKVELPPDALWVFGDRVRLAQTFDNLLSNAAKFTPAPGSIAVWTRTEGDMVSVKIRDTGTGIEESLLPHIFEPFRQARQSLDRTRGGLGLGLALVKGVVELHGGQVTASSAGPGTGTELSVSLPLMRTLRRRALQAPTRAGAHRLLLVEDNPDTAEALHAMLETAGHQVAVAADGEEGLALARRLLPDVILCDIGLPDPLNGYDVARALRADDQLASVRLVALTGYGLPEDRARAEEAGFDAHLTKPVDLQTIETLLAEGSDGGSGSGSAGIAAGRDDQQGT